MPKPFGGDFAHISRFFASLVYRLTEIHHLQTRGGRLSHELVDELGSPLGAIGFDGQVVERSAQLLDDGGCEVVGGDRR